MRNKTLTIAVATALMSSGVALAQVKGPDTGVAPSGPSTSAPLGGLPGIICSEVEGTDCSGAIPDSVGGLPGVPLTSTINLNACAGAITDVNVGIDATHSWVGDLIFTVRAPDNTPVIVIDRPGRTDTGFGCSGDNITAALDDEAGTAVESECAMAVPTINGTFIPNGSLASLDGLDANGMWTLEVNDNATGDTGTLNDWSLQIEPAGCLGGPPPTEPLARFEVNKFFNDNAGPLNPTEVDVTISCNTGLPLMQSDTISQGDNVTFVVTDYEHLGMDCEITESVPAGYLAVYENGLGVSNDVSCSYTNVPFEAVNTCNITNNLQLVTVEVTKWWMDENPAQNINYAEADYFCLNELGPQVSGQLEFLGDGAVDSFTVYPWWNGTTTCTVTETVVDNGVEFDDSECQSISVTVGNDASCNIYNTRLYEGIPTLSHYGLAIMALLMLGVGFVGFRRFV